MWACLGFIFPFVANFNQTKQIELGVDTVVYSNFITLSHIGLFVNVQVVLELVSFPDHFSEKGSGNETILEPDPLHGEEEWPGTCLHSSCPQVVLLT